MDERCRQCGAKCCTYFCLQIDTPASYEDYENIRWYVAHRGSVVHIDENGDWYLAVENPCTFLDAEGRCTTYENRPLICRTYSADGCDFTGGDYDYKAVFKTPQDVEKYGARKLGARTWARERAKARGEEPPKPRPRKSAKAPASQAAG